ncbi:MAG: hypothetical protein E7270_10615 [Lachnospiraceae bacterium]|nr:hypothetical protein [Lachnospiraceae bacterium]
MNRIILSNVTENEDSYKWSELNCFYKVFAIALGASDKSFFDYFVMYVSAYILYVIQGNGHLSFDSGDCVLEYYRRELQPIFGNELNKIEYGGYRSFIKKVYNELSENRVVIVPCDLFYLPYCKSYMELHKRHYMVVKGIDTAKGIVYILDNMHIELGASTIYKDFMLDIRVLYDMAEAFRKNFENICNKGFCWSISSERNKNFEIDNDNYFLRLKENILNNDDYVELNILDEKLYCDMSMEKYLSYANLRVVFYNTLKKLTTDENCKIRLDSLLKEWNILKLEMTYRNGKNIKEKVTKTIEEEKECIRGYEFANKLFISSVLNNYEIFNRKNAEISYNENIINIRLSGNEIYDIWGNADNGVIILKECTERKCNAVMEIDTEFGSSSHCGIYIEFEDGRRILFGSLGRLNMAVHSIDDMDRYELCMYQEVVEEKMNIGIEYNDEFCYFYSGCDMKCRHKLCLDSKIAKVGFFVKTWENCECSVTIVYR